MDVRVKSTKQAEEPRKRLNRLRSVKVTNLDKFRLSMKRTKSRLSQDIVLPEDSMELNSEQKQNPNTKLHDSPNYMKTTSCFNARSGSSQLKPGSTIIARKFTKGMKRMHSLKKVRKLPSPKFEVSSTASHGNAEVSSRGDDFDGKIEVAPAKLKLIRSGSIKISRVRSLKLSRMRLSKSRLDQASISITDDDQSAEELLSDSDLQKTINSPLSATSLKTIRTLYKMPSLRSKRRPKPVKKQSRFAEPNATHFDRATCSWALKSSKIPQAADNISDKCESESLLIGHVCPYTYCSLHGHQHSSSPGLKGFISTKRRLLKKQRSIRLKNRLKTEANCYRDVSRMKQSVQEHDDDHLMSETEGSNEEVFVQIYAKSRDVSSPGSSVDSCSIMSSEIGGESRKEDVDSVDSDELHEKSSVTDSTDVLLNNRKYANMWKLIYKHLLVPGSEEVNEESEKGKDGYQDHRDENQDVNLDNQVGSSEKVEFNQAEAIEFVQQAVDEILQIDEESPLLPISPNTDENRVGIFRNAEEPADPAKEDEAPKELKDIQKINSGAIVPEKPLRQRSKGFEKLRKMIITAKFVKAVEKLRKINPRKPRFLSPEEQSKVEKVQLRRLVMDGRKNTEEWMLDFALQQVIAKLAPAQQRRVGLLVKAFERVAPEMSIKCDPAKMPPTDNAQEEERSTGIHLDSSGSSDIIVQDPEMIVSGEKNVAEVDDKRSQPEAFEDNDKQELKNDSVHDTAKPAKDVLTSGNENEETNYIFDKEKFTNVWHMVYRQFIAQEATLSEEKKIDAKEQDNSFNGRSSTEASGSSLSQIGIKQDVNQADAIQLVQEAIDELLHLHEQLSDQQICKVAEKKNEQSSIESTYPTKENIRNGDAIGEEKDSELKEQDNQKALQRQTSKPLSRLKKLILSAKFVKTMEKLRKMRTSKTEDLSSQGNSGTEKVSLRRSSTDERRNGEDWMLDNTLQHVISKLAPAQQKRVALLTQAFETFSPELQQISRRYSWIKRQPEDRITSTIERNNGEDKFVIMEHDTHIIHDVHVLKSDDPVPEDDSTFQASIMQQEDRDATFQIKSQIHDQINTTGSSDNSLPEYKEELDFKAKLHSYQEQTPVDSQEEEHKVNDPSIVLSEGKYSKMWQLIYQHVKLNTSVDGENRTTEIRAKEDQYDNASFGAEDTKDPAFGKLEFTQSDANKLVQEALDGILQQPSINILAAKGSTDYNLNEDKLGDDTIVGPKEGNKSDQNAFPKYSRWKRAIICSKFVTAMERMQKLYTQKKRSHYNPLNLDKEAEIVHLRKCLMDERSNNEFWMLDFALRQAIAKLAPVQQRKVALLIEAFETITSNTEETTSQVAGDKTLSTLNTEHIIVGDALSQDSGKGTSDGGNSIFLDGKKFSGMWRLIYKHIKSGIPNSDANHNPDEEQIPTETDVNGPASDDETPCDSDWSSTDNENVDQNSPSANSELQQKDAIRLVEEAVNEIFDMQVQSCDDQSTDPEEKTIEEDNGHKEVQRTYNVMSKVIMCKKFIKAMEKMKKSKPKVKRNLPQESEFCAENVRLRAQRMDDKNCEEWMLDFALQQVIGKMAPTQKKRVSLLVEAFERVNPPPDSRRNQRFNIVA
ncbi:hypothetical protein V2J09_023989 [Rumex salicifolius]